MKKRIWKEILWAGTTAIGSALFALGFAMFLIPNDINTGGISGLAIVVPAGAPGLWQHRHTDAADEYPPVSHRRLEDRQALLCRVPHRHGGELCAYGSVRADPLRQLPEPLIGGLYGGVLCGAGLGMVFMAGASTGGSDILVRLLKKKYRNLPIGSISIMFDAMVVLLTGLVFRDISKALYSGVVVFVCGQVIDAVVYRFDYSRVALIISKEHEKIAKAISDQLDRGATYLHGSGSSTHQNIEVVLAVVRKGQLAELKELVMDIDENAFVIVQEAHQVLGDGFAHYSPDSL